MKFVEDLLIYMYMHLHLLHVLSKQVARQQGIDRFQQAKGCSRLTVKIENISVLIVQMASEWMLLHYFSC